MSIAVSERLDQLLDDLGNKTQTPFTRELLFEVKRLQEEIMNREDRSPSINIMDDSGVPIKAPEVDEQADLWSVVSEVQSYYREANVGRIVQIADQIISIRDQFDQEL